MWEWLSERIYYVKGEFQDAEAFKRLEKQIEEAEKLHNIAGNRFFYLAVAPRFFSLGGATTRAPWALRRRRNGNWARVIVEKPFGHDLDSARQLNTELKKVLQRKSDLPH